MARLVWQRAKRLNVSANGGRFNRFRHLKQPKAASNADWWARGGLIVTAALTTLGLYLTNFYTPEDLLVSAKTEQIGPVAPSKGTTITLVFTNTGKSNVPIDRVLLIYVFGQKTVLDDRTQRAILSEIESPNWSPRKAIEVAESEKVIVLAPSKMTLNNIDLSTTSGTLVEAGKTALASFRYEPYPIDPVVAKRLLMIVALHFFDKNGATHWKMLTLTGFRTYILPSLQDVFYDPAHGVRMLPASNGAFEERIPSWFHEEPSLPDFFSPKNSAPSH